MFGSSWTPFVQPVGWVAWPGASGIGSSPPTESAWSLLRYGQNVTAVESCTPDGQAESATAEPLTGFSGTGGLYVVAEGVTMSGHTAGPGVGRVTLPVRSPHQSFVAVTGVAVFGVVPSFVVFSTPKALSVMLLPVMLEGPAPTSRTPAPSRRFWLLSACSPSGYG